MYRIFLAIFLISIFSIAGFAQSGDAAAALAVADKLFAAMRAKDAAAIKNLFIENGQITAVDGPRTGQGLSTRRNFTGEAFGKMIAAAKGDLIEKMPEAVIRTYGDAAVVYGRYTFHIGEKFSHCGANAFHMLRIGTEWKIANITSTLEFTGCDNKESKAVQDSGVLAAVDRLFAVMSEHKPAEIIALHTPESQLAAVIKQKNGTVRTETLSREAFSKFFEVKRGEIVERMHNVVSGVMGDMAFVDGRYIFFVDGKVSHCGMNSFHLVRTAEGWKLGNSISTIEPNGCTESEKTMKPSGGATAIKP